MIQSRFSTSEAAEFQFGRDGDKPSYNKRTLFVSSIEINLSEATQETNLIQLYFEDEAGKDLMWESNPANKRHISYSPNQHIPVSNEAKLILEYANPDSRIVTARFLWRI